jgi:outer membrane protein TolC
MNRIRSLTVSISNSWRTIELSTLQLDIAERTYQLTEQAFQAGAVEFTTLETSRTDLSRANQQLLSDQAAYQQAMLDLAGALNLDWNEFIRSVR